MDKAAAARFAAGHLAAQRVIRAEGIARSAESSWADAAAMMDAAALAGPISPVQQALREREDAAVRERWIRLHRALRR